MNPTEIEKFIAKLLQEIKEIGIDATDLKIDHIAYSAGSTEEYEKLVPQILAEGKLIKEALIKDRRILIAELNKPTVRNISVVEIIEPVKGEKEFSGWEHAEFLIDNYDDFLQKYPNFEWDLNHKDKPNFTRIKLALPSGKEVKFLDTPLLDSVVLEK
jgi:predicted metalloenzyme YecM